ncbi:hypothetical protein [Megamonas hypermegale]|uniref:hypothetical protein n=1 Tax=Megamonas hypermegale TaxID=158847 RepID=UPI00255C774B|nr:hypothetical protein [Megamonas hypermegale]
MYYLKNFILCSIFIILTTSNCFAFVDEGKQSYTNLEMSYPIIYLEDTTAQNKINTDIANYVWKFKNRYDKGEFFNGKMKYYIKYEDDNLLSIILEQNWYNAGAAHGYYTHTGLVYNKKTGERIPLSYFVPIKDANQLQYAGIFSNVTKLYNWQHKEIHNNYKTKRISQDYYLGGNGTIYLLYQPYELGCFADGVVSVEFTPEAIDYFKRLNNQV